MEEKNNFQNLGKFSVFQKISSGIILLMNFLIPIFFIPHNFISTENGTSLFFAIGFLVALFFYILGIVVKREFYFPVNFKYIAGISLIIPLVYILSWISNGYSKVIFYGYTFDISSVGFIIIAFLYLIFVSLMFRDEKTILYSYLFYIFSLVILSIYLLIRLFFGADILSFGLFKTITSSPLGNWNNVGIFFGAGTVISLLILEMLNLKRMAKVFLFIVLLLSLFFVTSVNFFFVWLSICAISLTIVGIKLFSNNKNNYSHHKWKLHNFPYIATMVFCISFAFVFFGTRVYQYLPNIIRFENIEARPTMTVTMEVVKKTIAENIYLGSGPNTFDKDWLKHKPNGVTSTFFWNTDFAYGIGLIPTFAATTGLAGILSWILFFIACIWIGFKSVLAYHDDSLSRFLSITSFVLTIYFWFMAFVYVPSTPVLILTILFTGLLFSTFYFKQHTNSHIHKFHFVSITSFLFALCFVIFFFVSCIFIFDLYKNTKSIWYFQKSSNFLRSENSTELSRKYIAQAINLYPHDVYYRSEAEINIIELNKLFSEDSKNLKVEDAQKKLSKILTEAIKAGNNAVKSDDTNYLNWITLGKIYETVSVPELNVTGAYEMAEHSYTEAGKLNPKSPETDLLHSNLSVINKDLEQAEKYALNAIIKKRNYIDAYLLLAEIEVLKKDITSAIGVLEIASTIDPKDQTILFKMGFLKYNLEDYAGAVELFKKAIEITPEYANAKYYLGLSYEKIDEHQKAINEFEGIFVLNPSNKEVQAILEKLKKRESIFSENVK